jgi:hypothetical protein
MSGHLPHVSQRPRAQPSSILKYVTAVTDRRPGAIRLMGARPSRMTGATWMNSMSWPGDEWERDEGHEYER